MNIKETIINNLTLSKILETCSQERFGKVYIVGGFIRDHFLGIKSSDIDLSVEKNSHLLSNTISNIFNAEVKSSMFKTFSITKSDIKIDIANMRKEIYPKPGSLPRIKLVYTIEDDLTRRDFTINSLAASLNSKDLGKIVDPVNGLSDIKNHILRNNHSESFCDDPTRIFRAIKYSSKLNLKFHSDTKKQIYAYKRFIKTLSASRILNELNLLLAEDDFYLIFKGLSKYNLMPEIEKKFILFTDKMSTYNKLELTRLQKIYLLTMNIENVVAENLQIKSPEFFEWAESIKLNNIYKKIEFDKYTTSSKLYLVLKDFPREFLLLKEITESRKLVKKQLTNYLTQSSKIKVILNGTDLLEIGFKRGPIIGNILNEILMKKINGEIKTKTDELNFAITRMKNNLP